MADESNHLPHNSLLVTFQSLGKASAMVEQILEMIGHSKFFVDFTRENVERLSTFMEVYHVDPGKIIIREGDIDDYMMFIIEGRINIIKTDANGEPRPMTIVGPGATLGEMSMIDGEPRFASCIALEATSFALLSRDSMVKIILEDPALGAKILIKLVTLLSQNLRVTSSNLLKHLEHSEAV